MGEKGVVRRARGGVQGRSAEEEGGGGRQGRESRRVGLWYAVWKVSVE